MVDSMKDISDPDNLEVQISGDKKTLWINVDGICVFRASRIKNFFLTDLGLDNGSDGEEVEST